MNSCVLPLPRLSIVIIAALIMAGAIAPSARAETAATTGVTFEIVDEGRLDISWVNSDIIFTANGQTPTLSATSPPIMVTADFQLEISDTRADGNRTGYAITVRASDFTGAGAPTYIPAGQIWISTVSASMETIPVAGSIGATLNQPVAVLAVPDDAPPVNGTITLTIAMTLAPGIVATSYAGNLTFDVLPLSSGT